MPQVPRTYAFYDPRRLAAGEGSLSHRLRQERFALFTKLTDRLPRPLRVLDVGGTVEFWERRGWAGRDDVDITLVNLRAYETPHRNITSVAGDATDLSRWADRSFDIVFSNSVIEHLFTYDRQLAMAREVRRVGRAFWVQTPNYAFPIEPHFMVIPGWHWLPERVRVAILRRIRVGWRGPYPDREEARSKVREVRLMTRREVERAFPGARIVGEPFLGLTKSWVALDGFPGEGGTD